MDAKLTEGYGNPALAEGFGLELLDYLNNLPESVLSKRKNTTHAIKTFLVENIVRPNTIGFANQIKVNLKRFVSKEWMWDVVVKMPDPDYQDEDRDLWIVAESEQDPRIRKILQDANKLPVVRCDVRFMFFRANDAEQLTEHLHRLYGLFQKHRRSETGDRYVLAGLDNKTLQWRVVIYEVNKQGNSQAYDVDEQGLFH